MGQQKALTAANFHQIKFQQKPRISLTRRFDDSTTEASTHGINSTTRDDKQITRKNLLDPWLNIQKRVTMDTAML